MIVQEKLSLEVGGSSASSPSTPVFKCASAPPTPLHPFSGGKRKSIETTPKINNNNNNNNSGSVKKILNQTKTPVTPQPIKANRMADDPKFAKLKRKRVSDAPLRRLCNSGTNTPRCVSPNDKVSPEEIKRREAKLIHALSLTLPKHLHGKSNKVPKGNVDKAKRNLVSKPENLTPTATSSIASQKKEQSPEPVCSRTLIVKRCRTSGDKGDQGHPIDPRLNYVKVQQGAPPPPPIPDFCNDTIKPIPGIDMTIEHTSSPSSSLVTNEPVLFPDQVPLSRNVTPKCSPTASKTTPGSDPVVKPVTVSHVDATSNAKSKLEQSEASDCQMQIDESTRKDRQTKNGILQTSATSNHTPEEKKIKTINNISNDKPIEAKQELVEIKVITRIDERDRIHEKMVRPTKNYRKNGMSVNHQNGFSEKRRDSSSSESTDLYIDSDSDSGYKRKRKRYRSRSRKSPVRSRRSYSRDRSRTPSRSRSRSPLKRSRSPLSPRSRSPVFPPRKRSLSPTHSYFKKKGKKRKRLITDSDSDREKIRRKCDISDDEDEDPKEKIADLANPVPYDIEHARKVKLMHGPAAKNREMLRRNIYVGGISQNTTKGELHARFTRFGTIEKITLHFRERGDSYAFIIYDEPEDAMRAIEEGNDDPSYPRLELCFGGRRKFVGGSYVDFDGQGSYLAQKTDKVKSTKEPENDFDKLLQMALKEKKEKEPEWT